jgi:general secretion pathway protein L
MRDFLQALTTYSKRAFDWWASELLSVFPDSIKSVFSSDQSDLTLYHAGGRFRIVRPNHVPLTDGPRDHLSLESDEALIWPILTELAERRPPGRICILLPHSACLERTFSVPKAAFGDLDRIVRLELERATPFKAADVFSAHMAARSADHRSTLSVRHFIAKRETIAAIQSRIQNTGVDIVKINCLDKDGHTPLPINFLGEVAHAELRNPRMSAALAALCLVLAASAVATAAFRSKIALAELETQAAEARTQWQQKQEVAKSSLAKHDEVRAVATLRAKYVPTVLILDELTRILPDDVHLSDFKIAQGAVVIGGFASETARLISILETSSLFTDAALAAPVTTDPTTDNERFSIRFRLKSNPAPAPAPPEEEPL